MKILLYILALIIISYQMVYSDDLESLLEEEIKGSEINEIIATFKTTRLCNGHTIERIKTGELDFRVHHRFGAMNGGFDEFFGLDESSSYIGLEYGVTDWMMVGIGRATIEKCWNGFLKFSLMRQKTGQINIPISISYLAQSTYNSMEFPNNTVENELNNRLYFTHQLLFARKINSNISLQISPSIVHRNLVPDYNDNDIYAVGFGGRYKITNRLALNAEYFFTLNDDSYKGGKMLDNYSIGLDIDTGGHIFQLLLSNSPYLCEHQFIARSNGKLDKGSVHLGFNIMRIFNIVDQKN